ncbi:MAG TPA: acyltransferase [Microthrixaceae bacterium]|nr:acyltransferase [Microthrixaceae bacterium]HMV74447.1 acyltransferase [Microthrixaceae bacterium]HMX06017.1 acyltransferase [Microthrixaceae bacterium]HMX64344.1 acyltransferase [Microthrixaceae bacterium]HMY86069.1 acyltransferase [Microthrixaceae bacterium]
MTTTTTARGPFVSSAPKLGLVGGFDGIRGIGVMMVLVGHALFVYFESLVTIVDTFFVLSGFLITTLLLQEHRNTGDIGLRKFYARRAVRLLPSVWLFCAVWIVIGVIGTVLHIEAISLKGILEDSAAAVAYVYHLFFPNGLYMIEPDVQNNRYMWHLWTLSVEEWFYFAIPTTVLVCIRRNWIKQLGWLLGAGIVAIGVARWFAYTGFWQDDAGMISGIRLALLQRPDGLMLGALLAIVNAHLTAERIDRLRKPIVVVATVGLVVWAVALTTSFGLFEKLGLPYFKYLPDGPEQFSRPQMLAQSPVYWFRWGHTLGIFAFGAILFGLVHCRRWWLARAWSWRPFQWMGRMSYTLYVWHALPYVFIIALTGGEEASPTVQVLRLPVLIAAAFAVSLPVYYFVELRALRVKLRFSAEKEALDLTTGKMVRVEDGKVSSLPPESDPGGAADRGPDGPPSA